MKNNQPSTFNVQPPNAPGALQTWVLSVECWALNVPKFLLIFAIRLYRWTISPMQTFFFGATSGCRFTPTCSVYAMDAVRKHGAMAGSLLAAKRICRCHPWGGCGHDPVPVAEHGMRSAEFKN